MWAATDMPIVGSNNNNHSGGKLLKTKQLYGHSAIIMKAAAAAATTTAGALDVPQPAPESRHIVLNKLESGEYVLKVPRGGKSAVWKIFLYVNSKAGHRIDFVLCRYCCGLFMYKGYASGTSSLMNHGIRCTDKPKYLSGEGATNGNGSPPENANVIVQEEWPEQLKSKTDFTLAYFRRIKNGRTSRSPSPVITRRVSPNLYPTSFKKEPTEKSCSNAAQDVMHQANGTAELVNIFRALDAAQLNTVSSSLAEGLSLNIPVPPLHMKFTEFAPGDATFSLQHLPLYTALQATAQSYGISVETLLKLADGLAVASGSKNLLPDDAAGALCGLEGVVAAAAAAANSGSDGITGGGLTGPASGVAGMCGGDTRQAASCMNMSPPGVPPSSSKPESYQLRHNNHLQLVLNQLAEDEVFMDVTLTAEGRAIKAHKSVLSAVSPYFSSVLRGNPCQHPIIIMPRDVRYHELSNIIMYIYKGEMTVAAEDLPSLLKTAELLSITGLSPGENSSSGSARQQQPYQHHSTRPTSFKSYPSNSVTGNRQSSSSSNKILGTITVNSSNETSSSPATITSTSGTCVSNAGVTVPTTTFRCNGSSPTASNQGSKDQGNKTDKTPTSSSRSELESSPTPEHALLHPTDFMDLDMTCVKEELNSDNNEEDDDEEASSREVTTPPLMNNPPSPLQNFSVTNKENSVSSVVSRTSTSPGQSPCRRRKSPEGTSKETVTDDEQVKLNSLKTLANLASLDTPTNLSPSGSISSPGAGVTAEIASDDSRGASTPLPPFTTDPSPRICPYCSEYLVGDVKTHLSSKHAFKAAHLCSNCQRIYVKKTLLEAHIKSCTKANT